MHFSWNVDVWAVQKYLHLVDFAKSELTRICSEKSVSIQPRTDLPKFGYDSIHFSIHSVVVSPSLYRFTTRAVGCFLQCCFLHGCSVLFSSSSILTERKEATSKNDQSANLKMDQTWPKDHSEIRLVKRQIRNHVCHVSTSTNLYYHRGVIC